MGLMLGKDLWQDMGDENADKEVKAKAGSRSLPQRDVLSLEQAVE